MEHVLNAADRRFKALRPTRRKPGRAAAAPIAVTTSDRPVDPAPDRFGADARTTFESASLTAMVALQPFNVLR